MDTEVEQMKEEGVQENKEAVQIEETVQIQDEAMQMKETVQIQDEAMQMKETVQAQDEAMQMKETVQIQDEAMQTKETEQINKEAVQVEETAQIEQKLEETISDVEQQIICQMEYYFSDYNLTRDKYLRQQLQENDGWIPVITMVRFRRLKTLTEDLSVIVSAIKKAPSRLIEVSEDGTQIRRSINKPLPAKESAEQADVRNRTVFVKGFNVKETNMESLHTFFKNFGRYENISLRYRRNGRFKGSVYVTFKALESAENFVKMPSVKYKGIELFRGMKSIYPTKDGSDTELGEQEFVQRERVFSNKPVPESSKSEASGDGGGEEDEKPKTDSITLTEQDITKGCLMKLQGLPGQTMWEHIRETIGIYAEVAFVDYNMGNPEAIVRFGTAIAKEVLEKFDVGEDGQRTIKINDVDIIATVVEGQEELDFWTSLKQMKLNKRKNRIKRHEEKKLLNQKIANQKQNRKTGRWGSGRGTGPLQKKARHEAGQESSKSEAGGGEEEEEPKADTKIQLTDEDITRGCLMKLNGLPEQSLMWENIRDTISTYGEVAFVNYNTGNPEAIVRFETPIAAEVIEKFETKEDGQRTVKINDTDIIATLVEGQAELDFWAGFEQMKMNRRNKKVRRQEERRQMKYTKHLNPNQKGRWNSGRRRNTAGPHQKARVAPPYYQDFGWSAPYHCPYPMYMN